MQIEFFYDIGSPYSYLAALRVDAFGLEVGVPVRWRPFLLGAVFKAADNHPPARIPAKAKWMWRDLKGQAAMLGAPLKFPTSFPTNTLVAQRCLVAVDLAAGQQALRKATLALYGAYWGRGEDVAEPHVRRAALAEAGFDADSLEAAATEPLTKDTLRAVTDEAVERGAFGAPTFFVNGRMYFGSDRFELMRHDISEARTSEAQ